MDSIESIRTCIASSVCDNKCCGSEWTPIMWCARGMAQEKCVLWFETECVKETSREKGCVAGIFDHSCLLTYKASYCCQRWCLSGSNPVNWISDRTCLSSGLQMGLHRRTHLNMLSSARFSKGTFKTGSNVLSSAVVLDHWGCCKSISRAALWQYWFYRSFALTWHSTVSDFFIF